MIESTEAPPPPPAGSAAAAAAAAASETQGKEKEKEGEEEEEEKPSMDVVPVAAASETQEKKKEKEKQEEIEETPFMDLLVGRTDTTDIARLLLQAVQHLHHAGTLQRDKALRVLRTYQHTSLLADQVRRYNAPYSPTHHTPSHPLTHPPTHPPTHTRTSPGGSVNPWPSPWASRAPPPNPPNSKRTSSSSPRATPNQPNKPSCGKSTVLFFFQLESAHPPNNPPTHSPYTKTAATKWTPESLRTHPVYTRADDGLPLLMVVFDDYGSYLTSNPAWDASFRGAEEWAAGVFRHKMAVTLQLATCLDPTDRKVPSHLPLPTYVIQTALLLLFSFITHPPIQAFFKDVAEMCFGENSSTKRISFVKLVGKVGTGFLLGRGGGKKRVLSSLCIHPRPFPSSPPTHPPHPTRRTASSTCT